MNTAIGAAIVNADVRNNGMLGASTMLLGASASSRTPDQLIVSGPTTLSTATDAIGQNAVAVGLNSHANAANALAVGQNVSVLGATASASAATSRWVRIRQWRSAYRRLRFRRTRWRSAAMEPK